MLVLAYGLGTIIGAGIYVAVGQVAGAAGEAAPLAFVLAGVVAAFTGLSYAEFAARHPEAAGAAAYVGAAFRAPWLARVVGAAVALAAMVAAASIARGGAGYLAALTDIPLPVGAGAIVIALTVLACRGVVESVSVAAIITAVEIGGLLVVMAAGASDVPAYLATPELGTHILTPGLLAGAFIAFFAFIGFETMANMAEETHDVAVVLPRAIILAIAISAALYAAVALVAVAAVAHGELRDSPIALCRVLEARGWTCGAAFQGVALTATLNGVLVEIIMLARLAYGMANRGWLPSWFARIEPRRRVPANATWVGGACVFVLAIGLDFGPLVVITSALTLAVFALVNAGLWIVQRREPRPDIALRAPRWVPAVGGACCVGLIVAGIVV
jgi:amino acid transporter